MTSSEWLKANPPTHKCRLLEVNIKPEQCKMRKKAAKEKFLRHKSNPSITSGWEAHDVMESFRKCLDCKGPVKIPTHTYQRLDRFKPVDKKFGVRSRPKKAQKSKKESER